MITIEGLLNSYKFKIVKINIHPSINISIIHLLMEILKNKKLLTNKEMN